MAKELTAGEVAAELKKRGVSFKIDAKASTVRLTLLPGASRGPARELLYKALNLLEPHFNVFLEGFPACFMPDAWDHVLYRKKPGTAYFRVKACAACRLRRLCPGLAKGGPFSGPRAGELSPVLPVPAEVVFELTKKCNLNCRLCFASASGEVQPLPVLLRTLNAAAALGVKNVRFTGGEPFLSPSLLPLLKAAKKAGLYTLVNTNAALPAPKFFRDAAPFIDNVLVSLQAASPVEEKRVTGGDLRVKLFNMRLLRKTVPVFRLGTVASSELLAGFRVFHRLAAGLKADVWEIYRPMPDGRKRAKAAEYELGPQDFRRLSAMIAALPPGAPATLLANPLPLCLVPQAQRVKLLGAAYDDGHTRLVFDPRGFFKPSYYIEDRLGKDLAAAWRSARLAKITSCAGLPAACRGCDYLFKCLGGSRAAARAAHGVYSAPDPWFSS
jgi:MoaA/NifB/PqqE/SkfB family radical SAM enzyme